MILEQNNEELRYLKKLLNGNDKSIKTLAGKIMPLQANKKVRMRREALEALKPFNLKDLGIKEHGHGNSTRNRYGENMDFSQQKTGELWEIEKINDNFGEFISQSNSLQYGTTSETFLSGFDEFLRLHNIHPQLIDRLMRRAKCPLRLDPRCHPLTVIAKYIELLIR
jgi:hypothetical protein